MSDSHIKHAQEYIIRPVFKPHRRQIYIRRLSDVKVEAKIKQNKVMFMTSGCGHLKRGEGKSERGRECWKKYCHS